MKRAALLIAAAAIGVMAGLPGRAHAECDIVGSASAGDLIGQYLGRGACTCSALNAVCLQQWQGVDPRSNNAGQGFCAGSRLQCLRTGTFSYRTYTVTGAARQ